MSKYLWEYISEHDVPAHCNKYTVVYENKSFYYYKVNGTDELKRTAKNNIEPKDTNRKLGLCHSLWFLEKQPEYDELISLFDKNKDKYKLQEVIKSYEAAMKYLLSQYEATCELKKIAEDKLNKLKNNI